MCTPYAAILVFELTPCSRSNKAVADGAVSFYLDHYVSIRVSKFAYGVQCSVPYDATINEHRLRSTSVYTSLSGHQLLPRVFDVILDKVRTWVRNLKPSTHSFPTGCTSFWNNRVPRVIFPADNRPIRPSKYFYFDPILSWLLGRSQMDGCWRRFIIFFLIQTLADVRLDNYSTLCYVHADTSQIAKTLKPLQSHRSADGHVLYYRMSFNIILSFGLTEFKAQIGWMEDVSHFICFWSSGSLLKMRNLGGREEVCRHTYFDGFSQLNHRYVAEDQPGSCMIQMLISSKIEILWYVVRLLLITMQIHAFSIYKYTRPMLP